MATKKAPQRKVQETFNSAELADDPFETQAPKKELNFEKLGRDTNVSEAIKDKFTVELAKDMENGKIYVRLPQMDQSFFKIALSPNSSPEIAPQNVVGKDGVSRLQFGKWNADVKAYECNLSTTNRLEVARIDTRLGNLSKNIQYEYSKLQAIAKNEFSQTNTIDASTYPYKKNDDLVEPKYIGEVVATGKFFVVQHKPFKINDHDQLVMHPTDKLLSKNDWKNIEQAIANKYPKNEYCKVTYTKEGGIKEEATRPNIGVKTSQSQNQAQKQSVSQAA